jgi:hypothetical protein
MARRRRLPIGTREGQCRAQQKSCPVGLSALLPISEATQPVSEAAQPAVDLPMIRWSTTQVAGDPRQVHSATFK